MQVVPGLGQRARSAAVTGRAFDNAAMVDKAAEVRHELGAPMVVLCVLDGAGRLHVTTSYEMRLRGFAHALVEVIEEACSDAGMPKSGGTPEQRQPRKERGDA